MNNKHQQHVSAVEGLQHALPRIKILLNAYIHIVQQCFCTSVIIPNVILQLISAYLTPTEWIKLSSIDYCSPPLLINKNNKDEYILISFKESEFAISEYYEETDVCINHKNKSNELNLSDHTIALNYEKSLLYFVGGYEKEFAIYSLADDKWLKVDKNGSLPDAFEHSWYSPSICIKDQFHWISTNNQSHYIWNHKDSTWNLAFSLDAETVDAVTMIYIQKLNKMMLIASAGRFEESVECGSIWFSSTVDENKKWYDWKKSKELTLPFNRKLFGWIHCVDHDMLIIFGGFDKHKSERCDDIWCLKMKGTNIGDWTWKQLSFKCPKKCWYHAVRTHKHDNIHLIDSYGSHGDHWMINLETITFFSNI